MRQFTHQRVITDLSTDIGSISSDFRIHWFDLTEILSGKNPKDKGDSSQESYLVAFAHLYSDCCVLLR